MVVKLTQKQAEFLSTFGDFEDEENKRKALYHITRFGWGYNLTDGDDLKSGAFENSDKYTSPYILVSCKAPPRNIENTKNKAIL